MDPITVIISIALAGGVVGLILYPLWQEHQPTTITARRPGQTLEEYQLRYQAALASIKELMFDYEMGKLTPEDYEPLLRQAKLEAAQLRRQIDRLEQNTELEPALDTRIESLVIQKKQAGLNGNETLLREINKELNRLTEIKPDYEPGSCPHCGRSVQPGDSFCPGCGERLDGCPQCGASIQPTDTFCAKCGAQLNRKTNV